MQRLNQNDFEIAILLDINNNWLHPHIVCQLLNKADVPDIRIFYDHNEINCYQIVFVLGYTRVLPKSFINSNKEIFVVHESALPEGCGFSPVQWQILEGKNVIPITLFQMTDEVDSGPIVLQDMIVLEGHELFDEIRMLQADKTIELISRLVDLYPNLNKISQTGKRSTFRRRRAEDSELDMSKPLVDQFNLLRICNNNDWPAHFYHKGVKYLLRITKEAPK